MKNAKGKMIAVLTGIGIALTALVGQARADNIGTMDGRWYSVYVDGEYFGTFCICEDINPNCSGCWEIIGVASFLGVSPDRITTGPPLQ